MISRLSFLARGVTAALLALSVASCHTIDDDRIPPVRASLVFYTLDDWNINGIGNAAALQHKRYIKQDRIPPSFPYTAASATGFGGLLLVGDVQGNPVVYDLACPVERKADVRIFITDDYKAECPVCHSVYDVFSLGGYPIAGMAADRGYGLRRYRIGPGSANQYMVISN